MKIINHLLHRDDGTPYPFVRTPNVSSGALDPRFLVMHFTAGSSAAESISWLKNPAAKASAHIVIDKAGNITQMVPFNKVAWHAGKSAWRGIDGLNRTSIGIELDNPGRLSRGKDGKWHASFGGTFADADVLVATHKNETTPSGWLRYPQAQMDAALELSKLLVKTYGMREVIGHEDISPGRKQDPGPSFPMAQFAAAAMSGAGTVASGAASGSAGAAVPVADGATHATTARLKIRSGPGSEFGEAAPVLDAATRLVALEPRGEWLRVRVPSRGGVEGWVHGNFVSPVPGAPAPKPVAAPVAAGDGVTHVTTARLKIRGGPGSQFGEVAPVLDPETRLAVVEAQGEWRRARVPSRGVEGWVHGDFLRALPPTTIPVGQIFDPAAVG